MYGEHWSSGLQPGETCNQVRYFHLPYQLPLPLFNLNFGSVAHFVSRSDRKITLSLTIHLKESPAVERSLNCSKTFNNSTKISQPLSGFLKMRFRTWMLHRSATLPPKVKKVQLGICSSTSVVVSGAIWRRQQFISQLHSHLKVHRVGDILLNTLKSKWSRPRWRTHHWNFQCWYRKGTQRSFKGQRKFCLQTETTGTISTALLCKKFQQ